MVSFIAIQGIDSMKRLWYDCNLHNGEDYLPVHIPRNEPHKVEGMIPMSGKKKDNDTSNAAETVPFINDDDTDQGHPSLATEAEDDWTDEDDFVFDVNLLPQGVNLVDLAPDFVRPEGFLMVPRLNKKTGEVFPMNATFAGILHDIIPWKDARGKERLWFACESTADFPEVMFTGKDEQNREFTKPVVKGTRVGISGSGAINALKSKKGHFIYLRWTGNKVTVKNGDMWEIKAKVSDKPVLEVKD
jgi:hypothetical protein